MTRPVTGFQTDLYGVRNRWFVQHSLHGAIASSDVQRCGD